MAGTRFHLALASILLLASGAPAGMDFCMEGLEANLEVRESSAEKSLSMVTGLNPLIGHEKAASLAKQAFAMGKTIRDLCEERRVMDELVLLQALDPWSMTASQEQPWRFPGPTGKYRPW